MIKIVKRQHLDESKYLHCLHKAVNNRFYAEIWYLDLLTKRNWDCVVLDDYLAVMPIPYVSKFGIKIVSMPIYCQQLGVFYAKKIDENQFNAFLQILGKKRVRGYFFNEENTKDFNLIGKIRVNQTLLLNEDYGVLKKNYNRNRRRKLVDLPDGLRLEEKLNVGSFFDLYKLEYPEIAKPQFIKSLESIIKKSHELGVGRQFNVLDEKDNLLASLFYVVSHKRIYQLGATRNKSIPDIGFFTIIIDHVIKLYANTSFVFDFEGSNILGVNLFNASFNAVENPYCQFKNFNF